MSDLLFFDFDDSGDSYQIRFVGTAEVPEWVGADIVEVLYPAAKVNKNHSTYLSKIPGEWLGSKQIATNAGLRTVTTLYEPGLYALIARSNSPLAVPFQTWVYEDVLPSIRKTGSYSLTQQQPSSIVPPDRERLENIKLGMDLMYELGGLDERTQLALRDIVRDILLKDKLKKPALPSSGRMSWPVSDRARHLGYKPSRTDLIKIGKMAAKLYRVAHDGEDPPKREQHVDGATRMVKQYGEDDLEILDNAIMLVMEPPKQLPEGT